MVGVEVWMLDGPGGLCPRHPLHKISETPEMNLASDEQGT